MAGTYGTIRLAESADAQRLADLLNEAFVLPSGPGIDAEALTLTDRWVLDGDTRIDATAWAMNVPQWFNGRTVASRAIAGVAVASDRRGIGAGRALMSQVLERSAAAGAALATLFPSTIGFYRTLGFEIAGMHVASLVRIGDLPALRATAVGVLDKPEIEPLAPLYETAVRPFAGPLVRPDWWWDTRVFDRHHAGMRWTVTVQDGADVAGYAVLSKAPPQPRLPYVHDLTIHDIAWSSDSAARELLGYLRGFLALGDAVRWPSAPGDHLLHLLTGPGPAPDQSTHPWMLRILDVPAALSTRGWPASVTGQFTLEVHDAFLSANDGRWQVSFNGHVAAVSDTTNPADITMDVGALAAAYTGWRSITDLVRHGLAEARDPAQLPQFDSWFAARPWLGERF